MKKHEQYLEVLKTFDDFVTTEEWAIKFDEIYPSETQDEFSVKIRKIVKSISSLLSTGKWTNIILIDKSISPKKIKYKNEKIQLEDIDSTIHLSNSSREVKTIDFEILMEAINDYTDDHYYMPDRNEYTHFENNGECIGHKEYIAFEMAIRNKNVIEISEKLDYINEIMEKNESLNSFRDYLRGIICWEDKFDGKSPELSIALEEKKEYTFIAELPIVKFEEEIDFLNIEKEFINKRSKILGHLKTIINHLQYKLEKEYFIYKEGYYFIKDSEEFDPDDVIDSDSIFKHDFNTNDLDDEKKLVIDGLLNRKKENMIETADMFFMYDYFRKRKDDGSPNLCLLDLKCELTKYHGIKIEGFKEKFTYDECLERYEEFKNLKANFYKTEKIIKKKLTYMEEFIDQKDYRFILFY